MKKYILLICLLNSILCSEYCYKEVYNKIGQKQVGPSQSTYEKAKVECNKTYGCKSITYMNTATSGYVYKLLSDTIQATLPTGARTWEKTNCITPPIKNECTFIKQERTSFAECAQECKKFKDLNDALAACKQDAFCGGVTFTNMEYNIFLFTFIQGQWGYQLRSGKLINSQDPLVVSYEKNGCIQQERCKYSDLKVGFSIGCSKQCQDFSTLDEAKAACNMDETCNAITFTSISNGGPASTGAAGNGQGYQLRSNTTVTNKDNSGITFIKTCKALCTPDEDMVIVVNSTPSIVPGSGPIVKQNKCKPYQSQGTYLAGCVDDCRDYKSLDEALISCQNNPSCSGITFSDMKYGGKNSGGPVNGYGYQLRAGKQLSVSHKGESSWLNCQDNQQSLCVYKEDQNKYFADSSFISSQSYKTYADASEYCDKEPKCKGIQYDNTKMNYIPVSDSKNYDYNKKIGTVYIKDSCNTRNYNNVALNTNQSQNQPIINSYQNNNTLIDFYTECNYQGQKYRANPTVQSIDLRLYKSMSVPSGFNAQIYPQADYSGNYQSVNQSVSCQQNSLATYYSTSNYASVRLIKSK